MVDKVVQAEASHEGAGAGRIASADGVHAARGLIQPDTCNIAANGRITVGLTNETPAGQAHVLQASGMYHRSTAHLRITTYSH